MSKHYIIIGDGAAGTTAAQYIRQNDRSGRIEIYADDPNPAYYRAALTNYLIGELREDQIWAVPPSFYHDFNVKRILARVTKVDTVQQQIHLSQSNQPENYDYLLLAAGSRARQLAFEGATLPGVMTMRTLQDVRQVMDLIKVHGLRRAVIVGGGPLAMEWVHGLHERGVAVTYLLRGKHLMARVLDKTASDLTLARMRMAGIDVRTEAEIVAVVPNERGSVQAVRTQSGETIPCELVGVAIGVVCNSGFLKESGIALGKSAGIVVNDKMQTSVKNVYAAGDIADFNGEMLQLWEPARWHGRVAAINMTGGAATYEPGAHYNATRLYDLDFASVGEINEEEASETLVDFPQGAGTLAYRKLFLKGGKLIGAILVGQRSERVRARGRQFKRLIDAGKTIAPIKDKLLDPAFDLDSWLNMYHIVQKPPAISQPRQTSAGQLRQSLVLKPLTEVQGNAGKAIPVASVQLARPEGTLRLANNGQSYALGGFNRIGRLENNDIVLPENHISSQHAEIRWQGNAYELTDLGSSNGTFVNGERLTATKPLMDGDQIQFGKTGFVLQVVKREMPAMPTFQLAAAPPTKAPPLTSLGLGTQQLAKPVLAKSDTPLPYLESKGQRWELNELVTSIGRDKENSVSIDDGAASHIHAHIHRQGNDFHVRDVGSRNGTWVNQEQVTVPYKLLEGDRLLIGQTEFVFHSSNPSDRVEETHLTSPAEPPVEPKLASLLIRSGASLGLTFVLAKSPLTIGRDEENDIWLSDPSVSGRHAQLKQVDNGWVLLDLNSTNGTYRNKTKLSPQTETLLNPHDELFLGQVEIYYQASEQELVATKAPVCPHCGEAVTVGKKFCRHCGKPLGE